jgi:hypothetical protein
MHNRVGTSLLTCYLDGLHCRLRNSLPTCMRHIGKLASIVRLKCPTCDDHSVLAAMFSFATDMSGGAPLGPHQSLPRTNPTRPPPLTFRRYDAGQRQSTHAQPASIAGTPARDPLISLQDAVRPDPSGMAEPRQHSGAASAAQPWRTVRPPPGCQAPLCERHAQHVVAADALRAWRQSALAAIEEVGDAHAAQDGGSTSRELKARPAAASRDLDAHASPTRLCDGCTATALTPHLLVHTKECKLLI